MNHAEAFVVRAVAQKAFIAALKTDGIGSRDCSATARQFRQARKAIPAIGAVVGASLNGWYLRDVGIAAECAYRERWLLHQGFVIDVERPIS